MGERRSGRELVVTAGRRPPPPSGIESVTLVGNVAGARREATVQIPGPGMFVAQKLLIARRRRNRSRRGKDLLYVRDILANYPELRPAMLNDLERLRQRRPGWYSKLLKELQRLFAADDPLGADWMIPIAHPEGLPEALPRDAALRLLAGPFLDFLRELSRDEE